MKKLIIVVVVLLMATSVYAEPNQLTDGRANGRFFDLSKEYAEPFTMGCVETLLCLEGKRMLKMYPNTTCQEIVDAVVVYYRNNPTKKYRPIVEVLLSGCK